MSLCGETTKNHYREEHRDGPSYVRDRHAAITYTTSRDLTLVGERPGEWCK
ncbi:hypothetical protein MAHJHV55_55070 [Mycobacterium avium subsp. hominissuis]